MSLAFCRFAKAIGLNQANAVGCCDKPATSTCMWFCVRLFSGEPCLQRQCLRATPWILRFCCETVLWSMHHPCLEASCQAWAAQTRRTWCSFPESHAVFITLTIGKFEPMNSVMSLAKLGRDDSRLENDFQVVSHCERQLKMGISAILGG